MFSILFKVDDFHSKDVYRIRNFSSSALPLLIDKDDFWDWPPVITTTTTMRLFFMSCKNCWKTLTVTRFLLDLADAQRSFLLNNDGMMMISVGAILTSIRKSRKNFRFSRRHISENAFRNSAYPSIRRHYDVRIFCLFFFSSIAAISATTTTTLDLRWPHPSKFMTSHPVSQKRVGAVRAKRRSCQPKQKALTLSVFLDPFVERILVTWTRDTRLNIHGQVQMRIGTKTRE